jgi:hypothetical protein
MNIARFIALLVLAGCVSDLRYYPITPLVEDSPSTQEIRLTLSNTTGKKICVGPENWPTMGGAIDNSGDEIFLLVDGARSPEVIAAEIWVHVEQRLIKGAG